MNDNCFEKLALRLQKELADGSLISEGDRVLVAFSGGVDSVALLMLLNNIREKLGIEVAAAHLNHGIRGAEADRDQAFCEEFCQKNAITFIAGHADVPNECKRTGEGLEECARRLRYAFLEETANRLSCNKIATAHHADDNIETVLLHMIRGCGLNGLSGIPSKRGNVVRPLLSFRKKELAEALESIAQGFVYDSTNSEDDASRNLLRHTVLPQIYRLNPSADAVFMRMCRALSEDNEYLEAEAEKIPLDADRKTLALLPQAVLSRYIRRKYRMLGGSRMLDSEAISAISDAVRNESKSVRYTVAGNVTARINSLGVEFIKASDNVDIPLLTELSDGENIMSQKGNKILITCDKKVADDWQNIYKLSTRVSVNSDKIYKDGKLSLTARPIKAGDCYRFGGQNKNVRRQLINKKIPSETRRTLPCICLGGEVIWVPYLPAADAVKSSDKQKTAYVIYVP